MIITTGISDNDLFFFVVVYVFLNVKRNMTREKGRGIKESKNKHLAMKNTDLEYILEVVSLKCKLRLATTSGRRFDAIVINNTTNEIGKTEVVLIHEHYNSKQQRFIPPKNV